MGVTALSGCVEGLRRQTKDSKDSGWNTSEGNEGGLGTSNKEETPRGVELWAAFRDMCVPETCKCGGGLCFRL
jgi:hypothetical protein